MLRIVQMEGLSRRARRREKQTNADNIHARGKRRRKVCSVVSESRQVSTVHRLPAVPSEAKPSYPSQRIATMGNTSGAQQQNKTHARTHPDTHAHTHTDRDTHTQRHTHTDTQTHTHTHKHARTHARTHARRAIKPGLASPVFLPQIM